MIPPYVQSRGGDLFFNELANYVKGCLLTPGANPITVPVAVGSSPGRSPAVIVESAAEAYTEIFSLTYAFLSAYDSPNSNLRVLITDVSNRRRLMNRDIPVSLVFGSADASLGQHPGLLDESLILRPQQTLMFEFYNYSTTAEASLAIVLEGRKFQQGALQSKKAEEYLIEKLDRGLFLAPYWIGTSDQLNVNITIPTAGQKLNFFNVTNDIDLVILKGLATFSIDGAQISATDAFLSELRDAVTERPLQNQPVPQFCGFGDAQFPYVFPCGWIVQHNTRFAVNFINASGAAPSIGFVAFQGVASFQGTTPESVK